MAGSPGQRLDAWGRRHPGVVLLLVVVLALAVGVVWLCEGQPPVVLYERF